MGNVSILISAWNTYHVHVDSTWTAFKKKKVFIWKTVDRIFKCLTEFEFRTFSISTTLCMPIDFIQFNIIRYPFFMQFLVFRILYIYSICILYTPDTDWIIQYTFPLPFLYPTTPIVSHPIPSHPIPSPTPISPTLSHVLLRSKAYHALPILLLFFFFFSRSQTMVCFHALKILIRHVLSTCVSFKAEAYELGYTTLCSKMHIYLLLFF